MIIDGINAAMSACTALTDIVGQYIYLVALPAGYTVPAVTYYVVSSPTALTLDGVAINTTAVDINVWANSYHHAARGQQALHELFDGFSGPLPDGTNVLITTSQDAPDQYEQDTRLYRCTTTFYFQH